MSNSKPIVFFDTETTGLSKSDDRIVSIYMVKYDSTASKQIANPLYFILNPEMSISESAIAVHGISNEIVKDRPTFKEVATQILDYLQGCAISGYNIINFDIPMLFNEFSKAGILFKYMDYPILDSLTLWTKKEPRTLTGAVKRYLNEPLEEAHRAEADTEAQVRVFQQQLKEYEISIDDVIEICSDPTRVDISGKFVKNEAGEPVYNFGKNKGRTIYDVDPGYLSWMLKDQTFATDTLIYVRKFLKLVEERKSFV